MLLGDLFDLSLRGRSNSVGLVHEGPDGHLREVTFGEIRDRASRLAEVLRGRGLAAGDRVAVHLTNRTGFIELFVACAQSGVVVVPINVLYREREIAHIVADAEPRLIVTSAGQGALFPPDAPTVDIDDLTAAAVGGLPGGRQAPQRLAPRKPSVQQQPCARSRNQRGVPG